MMRIIHSFSPVCLIFVVFLMVQPPAWAQPPLPTTNSNLAPQVAVASSNGDLSLYGFDTSTNQFAEVASVATGKQLLDVCVEGVDGNTQLDVVTLQKNTSSGMAEIQVWGFSPPNLVSRGLHVLDSAQSDAACVAVPRQHTDAIIVTYHIAPSNSAETEDNFFIYQFDNGTYAPYPGNSGPFGMTGGVQASNVIYSDITVGDMVSGSGPPKEDTMIFMNPTRPRLGVNKCFPRTFVSSQLQTFYNFRCDALLPIDPPNGTDGGDMYARMGGASGAASTTDTLQIEINYTVGGGGSITNVYPLQDFSQGGTLKGLDICWVNLGVTAATPDQLTVMYSGTTPSAYKALQAISVPSPGGQMTLLGTPVQVSASAVAIDGARTGLQPPVELPNRAGHWTFYTK